MDYAPLNFDHYFKKVFSEPHIAQRFLEDILDVTIESIEPLDLKHKLTNDAMIVEFDYRCKIDGQYVLIDMQQWYKDNVVQRFYLYHCAHSVLQLERMPMKTVVKKEKEKKVKDYKGLLPTITLIWMVHDMLGTNSEVLEWQLLPSSVLDFVLNDQYWESLDSATTQRADLLEVVNNNTKDLHFLRKNRLIFAFQENIVKNKSVAKYAPWFTIAKKTASKKNKESDFKAYADDPILTEVLRRLDLRKATSTDYKLIDYYFMYQQKAELTQERLLKEIEERKQEAAARKQADEARKQEAEAHRQQLKNIVANLNAQGLSMELIMTITKLSKKEIEQLM